jgi:hypothetical protein
VALRWNAWRLAVSAFVVFHLAATVTWNVPNSPIRNLLLPVFQPYMLPLGLWQSWWMFAPDPMTVTALLEAEVIDAAGMRHIYEFPRVADLPWYQKAPRFRHPKFTCNLMIEEFAAQREITARYVARQLDLPAKAYPLHVTVYCPIKEPPPPGQWLTDPLATARLHSLGAFDFASRDEVWQ